MFFKHRMKREKFYRFSIFYIYLFFFITNFDFFLLSKMARSTYKSMMIRALKFRTTFFFQVNPETLRIIFGKNAYILCEKFACVINSWRARVISFYRAINIFTLEICLLISQKFSKMYIYINFKSIALFIVYYHLLAIYYLFP